MQSSLLFPALMAHLLAGLGTQAAPVGPGGGDGGPSQPPAPLVSSLLYPSLSGSILAGLGAQVPTDPGNGGPNPPPAKLVESILYPSLTGGLLAGLGLQTDATTPPAPVSFRTALGDALATDPSLAALVGGAINPLRIAEDQVLPAITFEVLSNVRGRNLSGPDGTTTARVRITNLSKHYPDGQAVAEAVRQLFDGFQGTLGGPGATITVLAAWYLDEGDDDDPPADDSDEATYESVNLFTIRYREPKPTRFV